MFVFGCKAHVVCAKLVMKNYWGLGLRLVGHHHHHHIYSPQNTISTSIQKISEAGYQRGTNTHQLLLLLLLLLLFKFFNTPGSIDPRG